MDEFLINVSDPIEYTFDQVKNAISPYNKEWIERSINEMYNLKLASDSNEAREYKTLCLFSIITFAKQAGLNVKVIRR